MSWDFTYLTNTQTRKTPNFFVSSHVRRRIATKICMQIEHVQFLYLRNIFLDPTSSSFGARGSQSLGRIYPIAVFLSINPLFIKRNAPNLKYLYKIKGCIHDKKFTYIDCFAIFSVSWPKITPKYSHINVKCGITKGTEVRDDPMPMPAKYCRCGTRRMSPRMCQISR